MWFVCLCIRLWLNESAPGQVHESGGGINRSVRATRASSEEELAQLLHTRLDRMLRSGTTLIEAKSGYGLETDTELKMLRVLHNASTQHAVEIVANFLGGHSVPDGMTASAATDDIVDKQIPAVAQAIQDGTISPEFMCVQLTVGFLCGSCSGVVATYQCLDLTHVCGCRS